MIGKKNILFVCGGSGGHILPCIAMAEYFQAKHHNCYFLVSAKDVDRKIMESFPYPYATLSKVDKKLNYYTFVYKHISSINTLTSYIKIDIVIAAGSIYSCVPLVSLLLKKSRTFLFEPNVIPGRVNSMFFRFYEKVFTGWRDDCSASFFGSKSYVSGIPIRKSIKTKYEKYIVLEELKLPRDRKTILILGGSQGSEFLNNNVVKVLIQSDLKNKINLIVLSSDKSPQIELPKNGNTKILPFTTEVGKYYDIADLIITRAGAITLAEICYKQIPNISIPYPFSANNHQLQNSKFLQSKGLTFLVEENRFDSEYFIGLCKKLLLNDNLISNMKYAMRGYFIDNAEEIIYNQIFKE